MCGTSLYKIYLSIVSNKKTTYKMLTELTGLSECIISRGLHILLHAGVLKQRTSAGTEYYTGTGVGFLVFDASDGKYIGYRYDESLDSEVVSCYRPNPNFTHGRNLRCFIDICTDEASEKNVVAMCLIPPHDLPDIFRRDIPAFYLMSDKNRQKVAGILRKRYFFVKLNHYFKQNQPERNK